MAFYSDLYSLVNIYEKQIQCCTYTKSDARYHKIKQRLHHMWAEVCSMTTSNETMVIVKKIQRCLSKLEQVAEVNEKRKYLQYYYPSLKEHK